MTESSGRSSGSSLNWRKMRPSRVLMFRSVKSLFMGGGHGLGILELFVGFLGAVLVAVAEHVLQEPAVVLAFPPPNESLIACSGSSNPAPMPSAPRRGSAARRRG